MVGGGAAAMRGDEESIAVSGVACTLGGKTSRSHMKAAHLSWPKAYQLIPASKPISTGQSIILSTAFGDARTNL